MEEKNEKPKSKNEAQSDNSEHEHKHDDKKQDVQLNTKDEKKEKKHQIIIKKEEAVAKGMNMHASKKHCMYISNFIKNKSIDSAIADLQDVIKMKRPVPFKGEIPHRKGKGMMSGRYPIKASKQIINILKALRGNVLVNGMDLEKTRVSYASATWASRPAKKGGMRFKRAYLVIKAREVDSKKKVEEKK